MKRTKETYFKYHPNWQEREGVSGCREFDGEDLKYDSRRQYDKDRQKKWLQDQMNENEAKRAREREEERLYAQQTLELTRMRGMLEDQFLQRKSELRWDNRENNLRLAKERKDKEEFLKNKKNNFEKTDLNRMIERGQKQSYP